MPRRPPARSAASDTLAALLPPPGQRGRDGGGSRAAAGSSGTSDGEAFGGVTASQVDPTFLSEIPEQLRAELMRDLRDAEAARRHQRNRLDGGARGAVAPSGSAGNGKRVLASEAIECIKEPLEAEFDPSAAQSREDPLFANGRDPVSVRRWCGGGSDTVGVVDLGWESDIVVFAILLSGQSVNIRPSQDLLGQSDGPDNGGGQCWI